MSYDDAAEKLLHGRAELRVVSAMSPQQPDALLRALLQTARRRQVALTLLFADLSGSLSYLDDGAAADIDAGRLRLVSLAGGIPRRWSAAVDHLPHSLWDVDRMLGSGQVEFDLLVASVAAEPSGAIGFGDMVGYTPSAMQHAGSVAFEVRPGHVFAGCDTIDIGRADAVVEGRPIAPRRGRDPSGPTPGQEAIGRQISVLVPDGATLQIGLGAVPEAVVPYLIGKRRLGLHSGVLAASLKQLVAHGTITGAAKTTEPGLHVATGILDGPGADHSQWGSAVSLQPISMTHAPDRLRRHHRLWAINSAFEVDLSGQPNAEYVQGSRVASGGGQADFVRAAHLSPGGASVLALPARTRDGRNRIVARLSPPHIATSPGGDIDIVVTEHGTADLRGMTAAERARALIAVAHPADRSRIQEAYSTQD
jgi:4-hydroxybutyrate CoA-transferase